MTYHRSLTPIFAAPAVQHDGRPALQLYVPVTVPLVYDGHALGVPGYGHMEGHRSRTPVHDHHKSPRDAADKHRRKFKDKDKVRDSRDSRNSRDSRPSVEEKREKRREREGGDYKRERQAPTPTARPHTPTHAGTAATSHPEPQVSDKRSSRHELPGPPNSPVDVGSERPPSRSSRRPVTPTSTEPQRWKALPEVPVDRGRRRTVSPAPIMQRQSSWERLQRLTRPARPAAGPMAARHETRHYHESTLERSLWHLGFGDRYLVPAAGPPAMSLAPSRNPNRHREISLERGMKYLGLGESRDRHGYRRLEERQPRAYHRVPPPARTLSVERAIARVFGGRARSPHHRACTPTGKKRSKSAGPPKRVHFADGTVPGQRR